MSFWIHYSIYGCGWGIRGAAWLPWLMFYHILFVMPPLFERDELWYFRRSAMKMSWRMIISIMSIGMSFIIANRLLSPCCSTALLFTMEMEGNWVIWPSFLDLCKLCHVVSCSSWEYLRECNLLWGSILVKQLWGGFCVSNAVGEKS